MKRYLLLSGALMVSMAACNPPPRTPSAEMDRFTSLADDLQAVALVGGRPMALRAPMGAWMDEAPDELRLHWTRAQAGADSMLALAGLQDISEETLFAAALGQNEEALGFSSGPFPISTVQKWMDRLEADGFAPGRWRLSPPESSGSLLMDLTDEGDLVGRASPGSMSTLFEGMRRGVRDLVSEGHSDREAGEHREDDSEHRSDDDGERSDDGDGEHREDDSDDGDDGDGDGEHRDDDSDDALNWDLRPIDRDLRRSLLTEMQTEMAWVILGEIPQLPALNEDFPPQASRLLRAVAAVAAGAHLEEESARARLLLVPREGVDVEDLASVVRGVVAAIRPGQPEDVRSMLDGLRIEVENGRVILSATLEKSWVLETLAER